MNAHRGAIALALTVLSIGFTASVSADPLPGEVPKFFQLPLNNGLVPGPLPGTVVPGAPYYGHDETSTAYLQTGTSNVYQGQYMADDFADKFSTPVFHVRWWGSYMNPPTAAPLPVQQFLISFESDVPVDDPTNTTGYSHPGVPLLNQIVNKAATLAPFSGTFTEKKLETPIMPGMLPLEDLYEYNAELHLNKDFKEHPDTVYWLKIVALVDPQRDGPIEWGWHDRDWSIFDPLASTPPAVSPGEGIIGGVGDPAKMFESPVYHFQDDAVQGPITVIVNPDMPIMPDIQQGLGLPQRYIAPWDLPTQYHNQYSKDLAFVLYTRIPEPSSLMLIGLGAFALAAAHRRRAV